MQQRIATAQAEAATRRKNSTTAYLLAILLGYFGIHRFYLGHTGYGIAMLLTGGGCGIWWLIDIFLTGSALEQENHRITAEAFHRQGLPY